MRSIIIAAAAFAATAFAVPYEKRAWVTDTKVDMVYTTKMVTVTAGQEQQAEATTVVHYGHPKKPSWWGKPRKHTHTTQQAAPTETQTAWTQPAQTYATSQAAAPSSAPARSAPASSPTDYASRVVLSHNVHRANHSASNIQWDSGLEASAAQVAASCVYAHNTDAMGGGYGQNIAAGVSGDNVTAVITNLFYNGEVNWYSGLYGQAQPSMANFEHWGHFSQIVWKATTHVGCHTQDCSGQGLANTGGDVSPYFTVCNYKSAGNFANEYGANVGEPLGHPTVDWNYGL